MEDSIEQPNVMWVEQPIIVRSYDVDFMQIVNNSVYIKWLEDLRMAILDRYYPLSKMMAERNSPILAETCIQYKHPVTFDSKPVGHCKIWLTGRSRWEAEHVIEEDGRVYATAHQVGYYFNLDRKRPVPFPDELVEKYMIKPNKQ